RTAQVKDLAAQAEQWPDLRLRDTAYAQLHQAFAQGDEQGVAEAAGAFLAALSPKTDDPRTAQVKDLAAPAEQWPSLRLRDAAYAQLHQAFAKGDEQAVAKAAAAFLAAPPRHADDPRKVQVESMAAQAEEWPNLRLRNAAYAQLMKAFDKRDEQ